MYFLSNLCTFCVISFFNGVNLGVYCEKLRTYCVRFCWNVWINSVKCKRFSLVYSHYKPFMPFWCKLANVTNSAFFGLIFLPQKQISSLCATETREKSRSMHKVMKLWNCFWIQVFHSAPYLQVWYFSRFLVFLQVFQVFVSPTFASVVFFQVWIRRLQHSNAVKHNVLHRLILRNVLHCHIKVTKSLL